MFFDRPTSGSQALLVFIQNKGSELATPEEIEEVRNDAIIATAAPQRVPEELLQQLALGGRLIIPVGGENNQELQLITREKSGFTVQVLEQVKFVPLLCGQLQS